MIKKKKYVLKRCQGSQRPEQIGTWTNHDLKWEGISATSEVRQGLSSKSTAKLTVPNIDDSVNKESCNSNWRESRLVNFLPREYYKKE